MLIGQPIALMAVLFNRENIESYLAKSLLVGTCRTVCVTQANTHHARNLTKEPCRVLGTPSYDDAYKTTTQQHIFLS
jgi:hypothetical protein